MVLARRLQVASYGALFHLTIAGAVAAIGALNRAGISGQFYATTVPALVLAAALVYAMAVAPYVAKRPTGKGRVFFDCAVGMLAEVAIVAVTAAIWALIVSAPVLGDGFGTFLGTAGNNAFFALLWAIASFTTHVLVLGNAAGFVGFMLLRLRERRGR
jgi:hypothetical protein